jgi:hypothetical protein
MKNTMKKYGFIALIMVVAVIAIGFTACETPEEWEVWLEVNGERVGDTVILGDTLDAKHDATGSLGYPTWYKDGEKIDAVVGEFSYKPTAAGKYKFSMKNGNDEKFTDEVNVVTAISGFTTDMQKYLGTWIMRGATAGAGWTFKDPAGNPADETLVLTQNQFKLDSTVVSNSVTEKLYFNITKWEKTTRTGSSFNNNGVKITGTVAQNEGYTQGFPNNSTTMEIYLNMNNANQLQASFAITPRSFVKQAQ